MSMTEKRMYWRDCVKDPPKADGIYQVLVLWQAAFWRPKEWFHTEGRLRSGIWDVWMDGYGWSSNTGQPHYWYELPPFPPLPYDGPMCEYFSADQCIAQENIPRCYCRGNKEKCEK